MIAKKNENEKNNKQMNKKKSEGLVCLHCFVSGRVQGVFFRRETYNQAIERGVKGWVRNVPDGRVEVLLCGKKEAVELFRDWLWEGPEAAQVKNVEFNEVPCESFTTFEIKG